MPKTIDNPQIPTTPVATKVYNILANSIATEVPQIITNPVATEVALKKGRCLFCIRSKDRKVKSCCSVLLCAEFILKTL